MAQHEKAPIKMEIQNKTKANFELELIQKLKSVVWIQL